MLRVAVLLAVSSIIVNAEYTGQQSSYKADDLFSKGILNYSIEAHPGNKYFRNYEIHNKIRRLIKPIANARHKRQFLQPLFGPVLSSILSGSIKSLTQGLDETPDAAAQYFMFFAVQYLMYSYFQRQIDECKASLKVCEDKLTAINATCPTAVHGVKATIGPYGVYFIETGAANKKTWYEARDYCLTKGMYLVSIESVDEDTWLLTKLDTLIGSTEAQSWDKFFWLGLNNMDTQTVYVWVGTGTTSTYRGWKNNQPDAAATNKCVNSVHVNNNWAWGDELCTKKGYYICEVPRPCSDLFYYTRVLDPAPAVPHDHHHAHIIP